MISKAEHEKIGKEVVDAAFYVLREMGLGLLESIYEICMVEERWSRNLLVERQVQLVSYMKLTDIKLGYLINFNVPLIKNGIRERLTDTFNSLCLRVKKQRV